MNARRFLLTLGLLAVLLACSFAPRLPAPLFSPTATATPTFTPSPTPTLTPTPLPTPYRIDRGDRALFHGDYETARREYAAILEQTEDPEWQAEALWGLGKTAFAARDLGSAVEHLQRLIAEHPDHLRSAQAHLLLGLIFQQQERPLEAAAAYGVYLATRPGVLDSYVLEWQGDAYFAAGEYVAALNAYQAADLVPRLDDGTDLRLKIGQTRVAVGDYAGALALYDALASGSNDFVKAQLDYLAGSVHKTLGQTEQAYERFRHAVENYPLSYYAYLSLVELLEAGQTVSDLDRGLINYFAGNYGRALERLEIYINAGQDSDGTAHYYRALTLAKLGQYEQAISAFRQFLQTYPQHPRWAQAWYGDLNAPLLTPGLAFTQWYSLKQFVEASQTLREFASTLPTHPLAIDYLMIAARLLERDNRLQEAAALWESIADLYPADPQASDAVFLGGITAYRLGDLRRALADFERSLLIAVDAEKRARAYLWIGKTHQKLNHPDRARQAWQQAQQLDATGYYSLRARDLLDGRPPFDPPSVTHLDVDLNAQRAAALSWMRVTFGLPAETDLNDLGPLAADPRLIRGRELWEVGLYDEARRELEALRQAVSNDAVNSFRLASFLLDLGLYRSAILAMRQVLTLAGYDDHARSLQAAAYFNYIRYGLYFRDLIEPAAQQYGFDPLFLFSVVRQESLFEGFARSPAGARGLMQIVPDTGRDLVTRLGWPPQFDPEMLYRPLVSVQLGTYYLASNRALMGGDLYVTLAAYNAGPGNALVWRDLAGGDPDLFLEVVRAAETRDYIRRIYEIYHIYRLLYGLPSP